MSRRTTRDADVSNVIALKPVAPAPIDELQGLLALPREIHALRLEVATLRESIESMRKALPPLLLSVAEAARALDISEVTVRRMVREGALAHVRIGRSLKIDLTRTPIRSVNAADGARAALRLLSQ